jgi:hypothetical protein
MGNGLVLVHEVFKDELQNFLNVFKGLVFGVAPRGSPLRFKLRDEGAPGGAVGFKGNCEDV